MRNKNKLYKVAVVSVAIILMLVNIVGAKSYNHDDRTCGCGNDRTYGFGDDRSCGCGDDNTCGCGVTSITDNTTQSMNFLNFPV
jgi:uncharacterized membrane protein